jgi:hypothetical protein
VREMRSKLLLLLLPFDPPAAIWAPLASDLYGCHQQDNFVLRWQQSGLSLGIQAGTHCCCCTLSVLSSTGPGTRGPRRSATRRKLQQQQQCKQQLLSRSRTQLPHHQLAAVAAAAGRAAAAAPAQALGSCLRWWTVSGITPRCWRAQQLAWLPLAGSLCCCQSSAAGEVTSSKQLAARAVQVALVSLDKCSSSRSTAQAPAGQAAAH